MKTFYSKYGTVTSISSEGLNTNRFNTVDQAYLSIGKNTYYEVVTFQSVHEARAAFADATGSGTRYRKHYIDGTNYVKVLYLGGIEDKEEIKSPSDVDSMDKQNKMVGDNQQSQPSPSSSVNSNPFDEVTLPANMTHPDSSHQLRRSHIYHSTAVAPASWSTIEGTLLSLQLL